MALSRPLLIDLTGDTRDETSPERRVKPTASVIDLTGSASPPPVALRQHQHLQSGASTSSPRAGPGALSQSELARQRAARKRAVPRAEEAVGGSSSAAGNCDEGCGSGGDHRVTCRPGLFVPASFVMKSSIM